MKKTLFPNRTVRGARSPTNTELSQQGVEPNHLELAQRPLNLNPKPQTAENPSPAGAAPTAFPLLRHLDRKACKASLGPKGAAIRHNYKKALFKYLFLGTFSRPATRTIDEEISLMEQEPFPLRKKRWKARFRNFATMRFPGNGIEALSPEFLIAWEQVEPLITQIAPGKVNERGLQTRLHHLYQSYKALQLQDHFSPLIEQELAPWRQLPLLQTTSPAQKRSLAKKLLKTLCRQLDDRIIGLTAKIVANEAPRLTMQALCMLSSPWGWELAFFCFAESLYRKKRALDREANHLFLQWKTKTTQELTSLLASTAAAMAISEAHARGAFQKALIAKLLWLREKEALNACAQSRHAPFLHSF